MSNHGGLGTTIEGYGGATRVGQPVSRDAGPGGPGGARPGCARARAAAWWWSGARPPPGAGAERVRARPASTSPAPDRCAHRVVPGLAAGLLVVGLRLGR